MSAPAVKPGKTKNAGAAPAPTALALDTGFDWSGLSGPPISAHLSESDPESDSEPERDAGPARTKSIKAAFNLSADPTTAQPASASDFERALLASPDSSFLWIQYMSFQLQLHEVDTARSIGRNALSRINYREESEKLNVWMALVNLEIGFGSDGSVEKVLKEAVQYNDARSVYMRFVDALQAAGKDEVSLPLATY